MKLNSSSNNSAESDWRSGVVAERISHVLVKGITTHIEDDNEEARQQFDRPLEVIEGPLMDGMKVMVNCLALVNVFTTSGKKRSGDAVAVAYLLPFMEQEKNESASERRHRHG